MPCIVVGNKTFRSHERKIENVVQRAVTAQVINLSVTDVCSSAKISRQAFYKHYASVNDVQKSQEQRLQTDFRDRVGITVKRELIFMVMLNFIKDNSTYFSIVLDRQDLKMITWMIDFVQSRLVPKGTSKYSYYQYRSSLKGLIQLWIIADRCSKQNMPYYIDELLRTRVMRSRLDDMPSFTKPTIHATQV